MELNKVYNEDCLIGMSRITDKSVDMILCDLPYGTTACKWDVIIPFKPLWEQYERVIKDQGVIVLTASQPFTSSLVISNIEMFRYSMVWDKKKTGNPMLSQIQPLKIHEDILVFYRDLTDAKYNVNNFLFLRNYFKILLNRIGKSKKQVVEEIGQSADHCFRYNSSQWCLPTLATYTKIGETYNIELEDYNILLERYNHEEKRINNLCYNPQMIQGKKRIDKKTEIRNSDTFGGKLFEHQYINEEGMYYPKSILEFTNADQRGKVHPTQKPVALFEYLIKTYTNEGEIVLDNCMGSGTTAIACINTNRNYIGFEKEEKYYQIIQDRIKKHTPQLKLIA